MSMNRRSLAMAAIGAVSLFALAGAAPAPPRELTELRCDILEMDEGNIVTVQAPNLHVLRDTARAGRFQPPLASNAASILCSRNSIIPAAHDDEVVWLGLPLHIAELGSSGRLAVLEIEGGRFRFRMLGSGRLRPGEQGAIDARLAEFQARFPPTS